MASIRVTNGTETREIDEADAAMAEKDGYRRVAATPSVGVWEAFLRSAGQGVSLGWGEKLSAAASPYMDKALDWVTGQHVARDVPMNPESALAYDRARRKAGETQHPVASTLGSGLGSTLTLAPAMAAGVNPVVLGGMVGGVNAAGENGDLSRSASPDEIALGVGSGMLLPGLLGTAAPAAGRAANTLTGALVADARTGAKRAADLGYNQLGKIARKYGILPISGSKNAIRANAQAATNVTGAQIDAIPETAAPWGAMPLNQLENELKARAVTPGAENRGDPGGAAARFESAWKGPRAALAANPPEQPPYSTFIGPKLPPPPQPVMSEGAAADIVAAPRILSPTQASPQAAGIPNLRNAPRTLEGRNVRMAVEKLPEQVKKSAAKARYMAKGAQELQGGEYPGMDYGLDPEQTQNAFEARMKALQTGSVSGWTNQLAMENAGVPSANTHPDLAMREVAAKIAVAERDKAARAAVLDAMNKLRFPGGRGPVEANPPGIPPGTQPPWEGTPSPGETQVPISEIRALKKAFGKESGRDTLSPSPEQKTNADITGGLANAEERVLGNASPAALEQFKRLKLEHAGLEAMTGRRTPAEMASPDRMYDLLARGARYGIPSALALGGVGALGTGRIGPGLAGVGMGLLTGPLRRPILAGTAKSLAASELAARRFARLAPLLTNRMTPEETK